jgi:hypothetical protein
VNSNFENALESTTLLFCLAVVSCVGVSTDAQEPVADNVYTDGKIYTVNQEQPCVEAVAIKNGEFIKVGSDDDVKATFLRIFS